MLDRTLELLFAGEDIRYRVPIYQRHYVWNEMHWEHLWNDIEEKANSIIETDPRIDPPAPHFTGVIVTEKNQEGETVIVDGQQRLTTFQIIFCALRDVCKTKFKGPKDTEDIQNIISECLQNPSLRTNEGNPDRLYKLLPTDGPDRDAFRKLVAGQSPVDGLIPEAHGHFKKKIERYVGDDYEKLIILYQTLFFFFKMVEMPLDRTYEPAKVFESLNGRGLPLTQFDLLRNNLFLRAGNKAGSHYNDYWRHFNDDSSWFSDEIVDDFLQNFLEVKLNRKYNVKSSLFDLYQRIYLGNLRKELGVRIGHEDDPTLVEHEFKELQLYSSAYAEIVKCSHESPAWFYQFLKKDLYITSWSPLVVFLKAELKLSEENEKKIFRILESYIVRHMLCNPEIPKWTMEFEFQKLRQKLINQIPRNRNSFRSIANKILEVLENKKNKWPSNPPDDRQIPKALHTAGYHGERALIKYILFRIEKANSALIDSQLPRFSRLTREHVMPQGWENATEDSGKKLWPLPTETAEKYEEKVRERDRYVQSIGNLTLLTEKHNNKVRDKSFRDKRESYKRHSSLSLNAYIAEHEKWNVEQINEREKYLVELFCEIWPSADVLKEELR